MKKQLLLALSALCVFLLLGQKICAADIYVVNSESRTLSHINTSTGVVNNVFTQLGLIPNRMFMDEEYIFVVLSGDNAIQMINRTTGQHLRYIPVAISSNPWDCWREGEFLYVTGLFSNRLYKISLNSYTVVDYITVGVAPEAVMASGGKLYVSNTGGYQSDYANSSISVVDLATFTVVKTIPVWNNPQYIKQIGGYIHVSCTGNWVSIQGKVEVIDPVIDEVIQSIDLGGNPFGLFGLPNGRVYVGDGMNSGIYSYDANTFEIYNGGGNPLSPGGIDVAGNSDFIAILDSSWGTNGKVKLRNHDFSEIGEYTVALAPTDFKVYTQNTENDDQVAMPAKMRVFPNPVSSGQMLSFQSEKGMNSEIRIYNLKGQLVSQVKSIGNSTQWKAVDKNGKALPKGIYLYKDVTGHANGKFVIK